VALPDPVLSAEDLSDILRNAFGEGVPHVDAVTDEGAVIRLPVSTRNVRPGGTISGPTMMMLADTAAWVALMSRAGAELLAVTTSLQIDFVRKPRVADLIATARIVKFGSALVVSTVDLRSGESPDIVATASVTYSRPRQPAI
jgi:uncharacterized protein (TIGR00369 family)